MKLMPFFTFYGGKHRAAKHYPAPTCDLIVEPFAGSAGYSLNYADRQVQLRDLDPIIVGTWQYLLAATGDEIAALPDLEPGQSVDDLGVPQGARWLIGWWLNKGSATPCKRMSAWGRDPRYASQFWGPRVRDRIAGQVEHVRHWRIVSGGYDRAPDVSATWFIDPPYADAGRYYRHGSAGLDYAALAEWVKARRGQVIACEAEGADWLPFRPLAEVKAMVGQHKAARTSREVIYP